LRVIHLDGHLLFVAQWLPNCKLNRLADIAAQLADTADDRDHDLTIANWPPGNQYMRDWIEGPGLRILRVVTNPIEAPIGILSMARANEVAPAKPAAQTRKRRRAAGKAALTRKRRVDGQKSSPYEAATGRGDQTCGWNGSTIGEAPGNSLEVRCHSKAKGNCEKGRINAQAATHRAKSGGNEKKGICSPR
jgi:hypothetical protein